MIHAVLDALGLHSAFEVIHSAEEETRGKPDPAVYLTTARKLGIEPECCIAIEDSPNGLLSAKAAGVKCIVVPEPALRSDPRFALADARVGELGEIGPELLDRLYDQYRKAYSDNAGLGEEYEGWENQGSWPKE